MTRPLYDLAASDGGGIGALALVPLGAGILVAVIAWRKYRKNEVDNALMLAALAAVTMSMVRSVLAK